MISRSVVGFNGYVMAVSIVDVCSEAQEHQSAQTLAIVLSIVFSVYTCVAVALSALTIYSTSSHSNEPEAPLGIPVSATAGRATAAQTQVEASLASLIH